MDKQNRTKGLMLVIFLTWQHISLQGMDIQLLSMMMEVGKGIVATPGEGVVEEVVTFVVVEEGSMVLLLILNMMLEVTTKKLLFKAVVLFQIDYSNLPACVRNQN